MKFKLFSIFAVTVLLFSYIPSYSSEKNLSIDAPKWSAGDSWSYRGIANYTIADDPSIGYVNFSTDDFIFNVEKVDGSYYIISMNSQLHIDGYINLEDIGIKTTIKLKNGKIYGTAKINKNNLGMKDFEIGLSGVVIASIAPVPIPLKGGITGGFETPYYLINFPLEENKTWATPSTNFTINLNEDMINFIKNVVSIIEKFLPPDMADIIDEFMNEVFDILPFKIYIPSLNMKCLGMQDIKVPAGGYSAFLISMEDTIPLYFSPNAANFVKANYSGGSEANIEMISTTYSPPGAPERPARPKGKNLVIKGRKYTYETMSNSPSNKKIQYGWDWDGDGVVDEWTDFYQSGEKVKVGHAWEKRGKYVVRAKARDEYGLESKWSEPIKVRTWIAFGNYPLHHLFMRNVFYYFS